MERVKLRSLDGSGVLKANRPDSNSNCHDFLFCYDTSKGCYSVDLLKNFFLNSRLAKVSLVTEPLKGKQIYSFLYKSKVYILYTIHNTNILLYYVVCPTYIQTTYLTILKYMYSIYILFSNCNEVLR